MKKDPAADANRVFSDSLTARGGATIARRETTVTPQPRDRYRVVVFGRPRGPWRDQKAHAVQDAIDMGLAAYDRSRREYFIAVPVDVEVQRVAAVR